MKTFLTVAALLLTIALMAAPAEAKGCIKGALVGGVAGHVAHHAFLGAVTGCVAGHHLAKKRARAGDASAGQWFDRGKQTAVIKTKACPDLQ
jgi:outer membrane lipoprotein SlyB